MTGRLISAALWSLAALFVAGAVHLASVLMLPWLAPSDAFGRISAFSPTGTAKPLPRIDDSAEAGRGEAILPFRDGALLTAACRYDLSGGPVRVSASVADGAFTALSLHDRRGTSFYGVTDRAAVAGRVELVLMTPAQHDALEARDGEDEPVRDVRVTAPNPQGYAMLDVLPRAGGHAAAERSLRTMTCKVEREP